MRRSIREDMKIASRQKILYAFEHNGPLAQLVARFHGMEKVIGSNPIRSTNLIYRRIYLSASRRNLLK